jgi:hypothetical protein
MANQVGIMIAAIMLAKDACFSGLAAPFESAFLGENCCKEGGGFHKSGGPN